MPDISKIETIGITQLPDGRLEKICQWYSQPSNIPSLIKKFMRPELFSWKDYAIWNEANYSVEYKLESTFAKNLYNVQGINYFQPHPEREGHTAIRITCELNIYPERLPGVPRFLANKALPTIENMVRKLLEPNLSGLINGLNGYFAAHPQT
jgi:hypothetical protein